MVPTMKGTLTLTGDLAKAHSGCKEGDKISITLGPVTAGEGEFTAEITEATKEDYEEEAGEVEVDEPVAPVKKSKMPPALSKLDKE